MIVDLFTLEDIESEISKQSEVVVSAETVYHYWKSKNWRTKKGTLVRSLHIAIHVVNSFYYPRTNKSENRRNRKSKKELTSALNKDSLKAKNKTASNITKDKHPKKEKKQTMTSVLYYKLLKTDEWRAFREFIFVVKGKVCENCGAIDHLQVHHNKYRNGRKPWEYIPSDISVLCFDCHRKEHGIK